MSVACHCSRCAAQVLEQLGKGRVVGDDVQRQTHVGDRRPDDVVVADVAGGDDEAAGRLVPEPLDLDRVERLHQPDDLLFRHERDAHQLDQVPPVFAVGAQGHAARTRGSSGGRPRTCPKFRFDQARFFGQRRYDACDPRPSTAPVGPGGSVRSSQDAKR